MLVGFRSGAIAHRFQRTEQAEIVQPVADRLRVGEDHRIDLAVEIGRGAPPQHANQQKRGENENRGIAQRQPHRDRTQQADHSAPSR